MDHQLRSIRDKLGVRSTARLVHVLTEHLPAARLPGAIRRGSAQIVAWPLAMLRWAFSPEGGHAFLCIR